MANRIQIRGDITANWLTVDPILADREMGIDTTIDQFKIGDGVTIWSLLPYVGGLGMQGIPGNDGYTPIFGVDYFNGVDGAPGTPGLDGAQGIQGIQGIQGPAGSDASVTKVNVEAVLTGEILSHTHPGGGTGDVIKVGTPVDNQVGVWTGNGTLEGDVDLIFDTSTNKLSTGALSITGVTGVGYITLPHQSPNPTAPAAGTILLHAATTQGFTRVEQDNEAATNLVFGRDNVLICRNTSGGTINKGAPVYVTGSTGNVPNIAKARANSSATLPAIGVALDDVLDNAFGQIMILGNLVNFDTSTFSSGDELYVSPTTAGLLTNVRPSGTTNLVQLVGRVLVVGVGSGSMEVTTAPFIGNMETGTSAATWTGSAIIGTGLQLSGLTASEIVGTDGSKNLVSLPVATYPSLTELTYVKGVTSAIQTQLNGKENTSNKVTSFQVTPDDTHYASEKLLKDSLDMLAHVSFYAGTMTVNTGTLIGGVVGDLQALGGTDVDIQEGGAADPLRVTFDFTAVSRMTSIAFYGYYDGGSSHLMAVEIYDINTTNWDQIGLIASDTVKGWYSFPIFDTNSYIDSGAVSVRLRHIQSGISSHHLYLDYVELNYGGAGGQTPIGAASVSFVPTGNISATNVAAALSELDSEKGTSNLVLGDLITNAYYGDKGKIAYDYSQAAHAPVNAEQNVNADWNAGSGDAQIMNKPTIPAAQVQTDWNAVAGMGVLLNKPTISGSNTGDNATNTQYSGLVSNATHTGDATGAFALTVVKIQGKDFPALVAGDDQKYPKYVSASNAFVMTAIAGGGDVIGPAANTADYIPQWNGVNSKTLKDGLAVPAGGLAGLTALGTKAETNQTMYLGTTAVDINRGTGALTLAGVTVDSQTWRTGITTKNITDASTTQNIAHGLGRIPKYIRIEGAVIISAAITQSVVGIFGGGNNSGLNTATGEGTSTAATDAVYTSATIALGFSPLVATNPYTGANRQTGIITTDATNIIITWTKTGTVASLTAQLIWSCT